MYETFFRLRKRPFAATPDPTCFFPSPGMVEGLTQLRRSVEAGQGIGLIVSTSGLGKTLLLKKLAVELVSRFTVVSLSAAGITTRRALLQGVLYELGERYTGLDEDECRLELRTSLRRLARSERGAVLIVDEADQFDTTQLGELRTWVDAGEGGEPYLRLVLAGLPALEDRLVQPELSAFNERISTLVYPRTLNVEESRAYVLHRLAWAGADGEPLFTDEALDLVVNICDGLPRCLNQLCDHALLLAYVAESPVVGRKQVEEALGDLKQLPLHWNPGSLLATAEHTAAMPSDSEAVPSADSFGEDAAELAESGASDAAWPGDDELAHAVFQSNSAAESFEVGADTTGFAPPPSADLGTEDREHRAVDFRTNVTAADLSPACEIDAETESRLRDLVPSDVAEFTPSSPVEQPVEVSAAHAWGENELEDDLAQPAYNSYAAADSRQIPPGEDWALAAPARFETSYDQTSALGNAEFGSTTLGSTALDNTALGNTAFDVPVENIPIENITGEDIALAPSDTERETLDESSDPYEVEVVRDPWSESTSEFAAETTAIGALASDNPGIAAHDLATRDVIAEVSESRQSGYVLGQFSESFDEEDHSTASEFDPVEAGPSDVLPFLAASSGEHAGTAAPAEDEEVFRRRAQPDFEIEPVPDRYAALDDGKTDLPPVEPTTGRDAGALLEPLLTAMRRDRDPRPDRAVDEILSLVEEARRIDAPAAQSGSGAATIPASDSPSTGASVRSATTVVDGWGIVDTGSNDYGSDDHSSASDLDSESDAYDTIEPESTAPTNPLANPPLRTDTGHWPPRAELRDLAASDLDIPSAEISAEMDHPVPAPRRNSASTAAPEQPVADGRDTTPARYKRLFSLLRRKHRRAG